MIIVTVLKILGSLFVLYFNLWIVSQIIEEKYISIKDILDEVKNGVFSELFGAIAGLLLVLLATLFVIALIWGYLHPLFWALAGVGGLLAFHIVENL